MSDMNIYFYASPMYLKMSIIETLKNQAVIPVISLNDADLLDPLLDIYHTHHISTIEITFRNKNTPEILQRLQDSYSEFAYGVGTVRSLDDFQAALKYDAKFVVTPGFNPILSEQIIKHGFTNYFPGVDSTLGIEAAQQYNLSTLKFFPASVSGGVPYLKALQGPYADIQFIPTGGVGLQNMSSYLELSNVIAVGGSFLAPQKLMKEDKWDKIENICMHTKKILEKFNL